MSKVTPVVLSGGSGSRLWPLSREMRPKQFLGLKGGKSLFRMTLERSANSSLFDSPIIVANDEHRFMAMEDCRLAGLQPSQILLEPEGRNTAPAIAVVALLSNPDDCLLFLPSDQLIENREAFYQAVEKGLPAAQANNIVTFGMNPTDPSTAYGYIEIGASATFDGVRKANKFVEKPDLATAKHYVGKKSHLWNGGIFLVTARTLVEAFEHHAPDILNACRAVVENIEEDLGFHRLDGTLFASVRAESIDYAIMEKAANVMVVPVSMGWTDLGSFSALAALYDQDQHGNSIHSDSVIIDCENVFIRSDSRLIAGIGLNDLIIIDTDDALLVADAKRDQDVKRVVTKLKQDNRAEAAFHKKVYRPWGTFQSIAEGNTFQVKKITVYPGKRLSLQKHFHRSEHWVVVSGEAIVTVDDYIRKLAENESVYIPMGTVHRLENKGDELLELIEVQSGSYLGEDDIVRLEDDFNRTVGE